MWPPVEVITEVADLSQIRQAIRAECKATIGCQDYQGNASTRRIWPFALSYFDHVRILVAWCELRGNFRHFREPSSEQRGAGNLHATLCVDWSY